MDKSAIHKFDEISIFCVQNVSVSQSISSVLQITPILRHQMLFGACTKTLAWVSLILK